MFTEMCGWGLKIKISLHYEISLFISETVKEVENGIANQTL